MLSSSTGQAKLWFREIKAKTAASVGRRVSEGRKTGFQMRVHQPQMSQCQRVMALSVHMGAVLSHVTEALDLKDLGRDSEGG